jgi:NDP-sugar pyrophosphorylase family protein
VQVIEPRVLDRLAPGYAETARDLYGPLLAEGAMLLGVPLPGAWYDLSSPALYLASQMRLLEQGFADTRQGSCIDPSARIDAQARIQNAVIGPGCVIGALARVEESVLWKDVRVGEAARVARSIVTDRVRVRRGARLRSAIALPRRRARLLD